MWARIVANAVAWAAVQVGAGYVVHRLPDHLLQRDRWLFRERAVERGGGLYTETLRIRRWKHLLPEAGDVFAGGFDKSRLRRASGDHLERHLTETRRAELGHWLAVLATPLFVARNRRGLAVLMPVYALAVNGPCIAAQRYNRLRLSRVLARRAGPGGSR
ncbi:MAG: glycosyl-4,4'-diaponeurosporenoate acyltransferase [Actinomycetota bacterium]|nr:glycosyl-4,4'-diaponeurosporenoate acyltransferase [Actinomycetota bacterium]